MATTNFKTVADPSGRTWVEVTPRQEKETSKGRMVARVVREMPAGFDGTFPDRAKDHAVVVTFYPVGRDEVTRFWPVADETTGLDLIAEQFARAV